MISPITKAIQELYHKFENIKELQTAEDLRIKKIEQENAAIKAYLCAKEPKAPFCSNPFKP